ncbi:hypothetical protein ACFX13_030501 [Malus domestica]
MQHTPILHLHFHLLLFYPREVRLEDVGLRGLLLVDASVGDGGGFTGGEGDVGQSAQPLKWVPNGHRSKGRLWEGGHRGGSCRSWSCERREKPWLSLGWAQWRGEKREGSGCSLRIGKFLDRVTEKRFDELKIRRLSFR